MSPSSYILSVDGTLSEVSLRIDVFEGVGGLQMKLVLGESRIPAKDTSKGSNYVPVIISLASPLQCTAVIGTVVVFTWRG